MIKMIVSDMDGTLLRHNDGISKENIDAIKYAIDKGVEFVIASGRDYSSVSSIMNQYGIKCMSILGNGAQFCDEKGNVLSSAYYPKTQFKPVIKIFNDLMIPFMVFTTKGMYTTLDPQYVCDAFIERCCVQFHHDIEEYETIDIPCKHLERIEDVNAFLKSDIDIIKVEAFHLNIRLIEKAKEMLKDVDEIAYLSSFEDNVEVTDYHAQKGMILEQVIKDMKIEKEEVIVLGDGYNDLTLFERFPYSFAPENAVEGIKKLAYRVVDSCENHGVSKAIYMML